MTYFVLYSLVFSASFDFSFTGLSRVELGVFNYCLALMQWLSTLLLCAAHSLETNLTMFVEIPSKEAWLDGEVTGYCSTGLKSSPFSLGDIDLAVRLWSHKYQGNQ